jgi:hypothetical protein
MTVQPVAAHEEGHHTVSYDHFSFAYTEAFGQNVNISQYPGDPVESAGPGFSDAAYTQFNVGYLPQAPDSFWETAAGIRVYHTEGIRQYDFLQEQLDALQTLLNERPDLAAYSTGNDAENLPFIPVVPDGRPLQARAHYVENEAVQGVAYIFYTAAAAEPILNNSLVYTFQGISKDGEYFINATFRLNASLFPAEMPSDFDYAAFVDQFDSHMTESAAQIDAAAPEDFTPSLSEIDELIGTFSFG